MGLAHLCVLKIKKYIYTVTYHVCHVWKIYRTKGKKVNRKTIRVKYVLKANSSSMVLYF